jgi:hypothetical protein
MKACITNLHNSLCQAFFNNKCLGRCQCKIIKLQRGEQKKKKKKNKKKKEKEKPERTNDSMTLRQRIALSRGEQTLFQGRRNRVARIAARPATA